MNGTTSLASVSSGRMMDDNIERNHRPPPVMFNNVRLSAFVIWEMTGCYANLVATCYFPQVCHFAATGSRFSTSLPNMMQRTMESSLINRLEVRRSDTIACRVEDTTRCFIHKFIINDIYSLSRNGDIDLNGLNDFTDE
ncbi:MAG: hypothetical protein PHY21_10210 [Candidatus Cloacimonetes bacterium]|nr:hypothetical protein [Candidatus Cloacimonadota bacterium]